MGEQREDIDRAIEDAGHKAGASDQEIESVKERAHMIEDVLSGSGAEPGAPSPCDGATGMLGEPQRGRGGGRGEYGDGEGGDGGDRNDSRR